MADTSRTIGFIGLGNMGAPMAARLAAAGHSLVAYDAAGTQGRAPAGAVAAGSAAGVAQAADIVLLSLPDGPVVQAVVADLAGAEGRRAGTVIDHSTIGVAAAKAAEQALAQAGLRFLDAPVSGGVAGARAGSLAMMVAGDRSLFARWDDVLAPMAGNRFWVGPEPGQGQAMKLLNNFLSAIAMAATSEAVVFGEHHGLELTTMIDVLNASTGRNSATMDKFPNRIIPGSFDAGFTVDLLGKDVRLFVEAVAEAGTPARLGPEVNAILDRMKAAMPGADFTRIYSFTRDGSRDGAADREA